MHVEYFKLPFLFRKCSEVVVLIQINIDKSSNVR